MNIIAGDKVYHKSNSSIIWVVDKIEKDIAFCSTVIKDTFEKKEEKFYLTSISKVIHSGFGIHVGPGTRRNHF